METEPTWAELLGSNNWDNLIQPLHLNLRKLILRSGDFCQATYDAFNNDANSKYCGSSRYGKSSFFHKVMLEDASNYQIASFLYGTARVSLPEAFLLHSRSRESWDRETNWIGYIAVTTDEVSQSLGHREIYVAWRGTTRDYEWINIMGADRESIKPLLQPDNDENGEEDDEEKGSSSSDEEHPENHGPKVMRGWYTIYTSDDPKSAFTKVSVRLQLLTKLKELKEKYEGEELSIVLTGHSLGASLSILAALDLAENGFSDIPIAAIVFGSPQVGNSAFKKRLQRHKNVNVLHVRNKIDVIPHYPGHVLGYVYIGTELSIDTRKSPSLKDSKNPSDWHNLQAILHVVAGWNGVDEKFELKVKRDVSLVNKSCDYLKEECFVPASWWVEKNKGMVRNENGYWVLAPASDEDVPVPEDY